MPDSVHALAFNHVAYSYANAPVLRDVTATVPDAQLTCILGPNGCGKSTLLKLADGMLKPSAGDIAVDGMLVRQMKPRERAQRIAVLAQTNQVPAMTVRELVACGRYPYAGIGGRLAGDDEDAINRAIELCNLEKLEDEPLDRLSGGQRQRAFIALACAQEAHVMLLDEPTTYLDVGACHAVLELLHTIATTRGAAVCAVIHDLDLALRHADRLIVIQDGCAEEGTRDEMLASGAIQRAFGIEIDAHDSARGRGYVVYPARP